MRKTILLPLLFFALPLFAQSPPGAPCTAKTVNTAYNDNVNNVAYLCVQNGSVYFWKAGVGIGAPTVGCSSVNYGASYTDVSTGTVYTCGASGWYGGGSAAGTVQTGLALQLPSWRLALTKVRNGGGDARVLFVGDSTTAGIGSTNGSTNPNPGSFPTRLAAMVGGYVPSAVGLAVPPRTSLGVTDSRFTVGTGWAQSNFGFANEGSYYANGASGTLTFTPASGTYDSFDVYYVQAGGWGTMSVQATGGSATPVNCNNATTIILKVTVIAGSAGTANAVTITDSAGQIAIVGIEPFLSTASRIRFANGGIGGSTTSDWAYTNLGVETQALLAAYQPNLTIISLGINDANASTPAATVSANLQTLIGWAKTYGDVILVTMPPSSGLTTIESGYVQAYYQLAAQNRVPLVDIYQRFGSAWAGSNWMTDSFHPNNQGYFDIAGALDAFLRQTY